MRSLQKALGYIEYHEQPAWVIYHMTYEEAITKTAKRDDNFREDPEVPTGSATLADYRGSGYDRGHLASAADMAFSIRTMDDSFYMSNMSPQQPAFNRGYKVIYDRTPPEKMIGFILPNEGSDRPLQDFAVTVDAVEDATGLDFFPLIFQPTQEELESSISVKDWRWSK